jgi:hypothetical protein
MGAPSTNFFQKLIQIHKMWLKLAKIGNNWPIFKRFSAIFTFFRSWNIPELRPFLNNYIQKWDFWKKIQKFHFCSILPILATIYEVKITFWKKLVEGAPITYFQINIFWFYMLWGIQNQLRIFFCEVIWVNSSLSMMWAALLAFMAHVQYCFPFRDVVLKL